MTLQSARERARSDVRAEILRVTREHLAREGAGSLSLRAVARDLGLVSASAIYRYFDNRDSLLTALIIESYDALGAATEATLVTTRRQPPRERWVAAARAIRQWAVANPHEYALLYGSPIPGYAAPDDTVGPGTRASLALLQIVRDAHHDGLLCAPVAVEAAGDIAPAVDHDLELLRDAIALEYPAPTVLATLLAWTQLFGLVSFEVFGQTKGVVHDHAAFFDAAATTMGAAIGL